MASTYSNIKIQLMATGENANSWGDVTNTNLGTAIEEAIVGSADVTFSSGNVTLTLTDTNSTQTARNMRLNLTGTTGGSTRTLSVPNIEKLYVVNNGCADAVEVKNTTGVNVSVPAGATMWVYSTGTGVVDVVSHISALTLGTPLAVAQGGTGSNTGVNLASSVTDVLPTLHGGTGSNLATYCNLQANVSGVLPTANGGTGSNLATYCNLQSNISGVLPVANGGTGQSSYTDGQLLIGKTTGNTLVKGTLTAGTGITVTNGDGAITIASTTGITNATAQASTSGTSIDFTSIPAGTKRIVVMFAGVSTNGTANIIIQLGDSGGLETTGYVCVDNILGGGISASSATNGFNIDNNDAASVWHGALTLNLVNASTNTWVASGSFCKSNASNAVLVTGSKSLSDTLDRLSVTTANTFDAGSINISYQS